MKITCGTDIVEIDRIKNDIDNLGEKFKTKIFTKKEIDYCESKKTQKYQHYAARFAAKEAVFKAISNVLENKYSVAWKDIEITSNKQNKPEVNLSGSQFKEIDCIDISLSHCKEYAIANVVVGWR